MLSCHCWLDTTNQISSQLLILNLNIIIIIIFPFQFSNKFMWCEFLQQTTMASTSIINSLTCASRTPSTLHYLTRTPTTSSRFGINHCSIQLSTRFSSLTTSPVLCKAVSVESQTKIDGLNIADDVTQVLFTLLISFALR